MKRRLLSMLLVLLMLLAPMQTGMAEIYVYGAEDAVAELPADELLEDEAGEIAGAEGMLDADGAAVYGEDGSLPAEDGEEPEAAFPEGLDLSDVLADVVPPTTDEEFREMLQDGLLDVLAEDGDGWTEEIPELDVPLTAYGTSPEDDVEPVGEEPATEDEEPTTDGEEPATEGEKPSTENEEPATDGEDTVTDGEEPATDGEGPVTEGEEPATEGEEPAADGEGPVTEGEEPATDGESTVTEGEKPVTEGEEQSTEGEEPASEGEEPATDGEGTVTEGEEPATEGTATAGEGQPTDGEGAEGGETPEVTPGEPTEEPLVVRAPATTIALSKTKLTVGVGEKLTLSAVDSDPEGGAITWASASKAIATVTRTGGAVKGVKAGTVAVRAMNEKGAWAECTVVVKAAPTKVSLSPATLYLGLNERVQLKPKLNSGSACSTFKWANRDKKIAAVNSKGVIRGVAKGKTQIRVTTYNGKQFIMNVVVRKAATGITLSRSARNLGVGQSFTLTSALTPANSSATVIYSSSDTSVAKVSASTGKVTAMGVGECNIVAATWYEGVSATCHVTVYKAPESISIDTATVKLHTTALKSFSLKGHVGLSEGSYSDLTFTSSKPKVATVKKNGTVKAVAKGKSVITVSTYNGLSAKVTVKVYEYPGSVSVSPTKVELLLGETSQITPKFPSYSAPATVTYTSSKKSVATVSEDGLITAGDKRGTATITARTVNGKTAKTTVVVMDPAYPERASFTKKPGLMDVGDTFQVQWKTVPSTADPNFKWTSSNSKVVKVSSAGKLTALKYGSATITATSRVNPKIKISFSARVWIGSLTLNIPARTTKLTSGSSAITKNLNKIEAVRKSAIWMVDWHKNKGQISASDAKKRKSIINNAFKDYAFPWVTLKLQKYWRAANSEGGAKDFKPGTVYFGMPYISGSGGNRAYNRAKALSQSRYTDSGKGYYVLNQKKLLDGLYCGNDCSCFVDAAIWGTGSAHSYDRTTEIAKSSAYRTVSFASMRPGDLICKSGAHVVMFLYYANLQKTKIMMIENGGAEKGTNTVHCDIYDLSYYTKRGYSVRRLKSLG